MFQQNLRFILYILRIPDQRKHVIRWILSLQKDYLLKAKQPWLVFDAIDFLNRIDIKGKRVFEYGSGGSTLYWLKKGARCISIEHDKEWYNKVRAFVPNSPNLDYRLIEPQLSSNQELLKDPADPSSYATGDDRLRQFELSLYVKQIDGFPDEYFDIILIDGRARPSCIKHSASKVKPGGLLIVDNSDRKYYLTKTIEYLKNFQRNEFYGVVPSVREISRTDIFIR